MAFDSSGNLFVSDQSHHKIKKLTFDPSTGAATSSDFAVVVHMHMQTEMEQMLHLDILGV